MKLRAVFSIRINRLHSKARVIVLNDHFRISWKIKNELLKNNFDCLCDSTSLVWVIHSDVTEICFAAKLVRNFELSFDFEKLNLSFFC